ncbi:MAG: UDP-N-acetylmuramate--L-alanine ligase [Frankiales bacterium]|nr:UDP-N-acetylmuramate--L-alanine ligase [Frankiales bacterium]
MSGIARIMLSRGIEVSGCDARDSLALTALRARGATVAVGHDPGHVAFADTLVVSSAVRPTVPELAEAQRLGRRVLPRGAALAAVMAGARGIAVAGTHGKTTTTSMLTVALQACGLDPSYAIGGDLGEPGSNAHQGTGEFFVAEADESDRSFLLLAPEVAVVTNVEADHLDNYADGAAVHRAFAEFLDRVAAGGAVALGVDDAGARELFDAAVARGLRTTTFGLADDADVRVTDLILAGGGSTFSVVAGGRRLGQVVLRVPGSYNAVNAAGALAAGMALELPFTQLVRGLAEFTGARRRFEAKGEADGIRVFDDYAHHPTELRAVLGAARAVTAGRVVVVFQPHLFSRTQAFARDFAAALTAADVAVVMEVYAAREDPVPGVTGALVADAVPAGGTEVHYEPSWSAVPELVGRIARPGDVVLTVGAGDVTMLGPEILAAIETSAR